MHERMTTPLPTPRFFVSVASTGLRFFVSRLFAALARGSASVDLARSEGGVRPDATAFDIRLLFVATRAARQVHKDAWQRVLELMIDGLAAKRVPKAARRP